MVPARLARDGAGLIASLALGIGVVGCGGKPVTRAVTTTSPTTATTTTTRTVSATTATATRHLTTSTPTASARATPQCTPIDLGIHFVGTLGAAGSLFSQFEFINVSAHPCHLYGYPGLAAYTRTGDRIALTVRRDPTHRPRQLQLAPRQGGGFSVRSLSNAAGVCVAAYHLRFTPPNDYSTLEIAHRLSICGARVTLTAVGSSGDAH
jgi:hypothetical protein